MQRLTFPLLFAFSSLMVGSGVCFAQTWSSIDGGVRGSGQTVYAFLVDNNNLYVGGLFTMAGNVTARSVAKWDGTDWSSVDGGAGGSYPTIFSLVAYKNEIYAGGAFDSIGEARSRGIAKWNGSLWSALGLGIKSRSVNIGRVTSMIVYANELYAAGEFDTAGGIPAHNIAKWDGSNWFPVGSGTNALDVKAMAVYHDELYLGGSNGLVKWNGSTWINVSPGPAGSFVFSLAVYNNQLYAGCGVYFVTADSQNFVARWDGSIWTRIAVKRFGWFGSFAVYNNELYTSGPFDSTDGVNPSNGIARWNGSRWSAVSGGSVGAIFSLTVYQNELIAGGQFDSAGGALANSIARLLPAVGMKNDQEGDPKEFSLFQNYPNPFNPRTDFRFRIAEFGLVTFKVFDVLGQEVATLVNEKKAPDEYSVSWDASNLPSGVYFYRLQAGKFTDIKKMLIIR